MNSVRTARDEDLAKLSAVERRAGQLFADTPYAFLCSGPTLSRKILADQHALGAVWVAVDADDEPVGFAVAGEHGGEGYLYELDVVPEHGMRGLGSALVAKALEWARAAGYETVTLSTFDDLAWNAPFYAKLGFVALTNEELTPAMHETRSFEAKAGFPLERRIFMRISTRPIA
jgi:GNAT superfamily N-acetyltransferase